MFSKARNKNALLAHPQTLEAKRSNQIKKTFNHVQNKKCLYLTKCFPSPSKCNDKCQVTNKEKETVI